MKNDKEFARIEFAAWRRGCVCFFLFTYWRYLRHSVSFLFLDRRIRSVHSTNSYTKRGRGRSYYSHIRRLCLSFHFVASKDPAAGSTDVGHTLSLYGRRARIRPSGTIKRPISMGRTEAWFFWTKPDTVLFSQWRFFWNSPFLLCSSFYIYRSLWFYKNKNYFSFRANRAKRHYESPAFRI